MTLLSIVKMDQLISNFCLIEVAKLPGICFTYWRVSGGSVDVVIVAELVLRKNLKYQFTALTAKRLVILFDDCLFAEFSAVVASYFIRNGRLGGR
jgi:hypothetical protein